MKITLTKTNNKCFYNQDFIGVCKECKEEFITCDNIHEEWNECKWNYCSHCDVKIVWDNEEDDEKFLKK